MRISSSGAFHNLLLWLVLNVAARAGADRLLWSGLQYADTSAWGRVVVGVEQVARFRATSLADPLNGSIEFAAARLPRSWLDNNTNR